VATIDLGKLSSIQTITIGCLQHYRDWIMMPQWVSFEISVDGEQFTEVARLLNDVSLQNQASVIKDFTASFPERKARFVRVTAKKIDALPKGHPGQGQPAWIFADEIIVN
jgi:hexosaminidase